MKRLSSFFFVIIFIIFFVISALSDTVIPSNIKKEYKYGTKDKSITTVKERLQELGYFSPTAEFSTSVGEPLKKAVKEFQKKNNLKQDAKLNMALFAVLFSDNAVANGTIETAQTKRAINQVINTKSTSATIKGNKQSTNYSVYIIISIIFLVLFLKLLVPVINKSVFFNSNKELSTIDCMDGITFEHWCAEMLKRLGYTSIRVTKASGDFGADIVCFYKNKKVVVQCKRYSKRVNLKSVQEILGARAHYCASEMMVITNNYFASSAVQLARETGVILIDRSDLQQNLKVINGEYRKEKRKKEKEIKLQKKQARKSKRENRTSNKNKKSKDILKYQSNSEMCTMHDKPNQNNNDIIQHIAGRKTNIVEDVPITTILSNDKYVQPIQDAVDTEKTNCIKNCNQFSPSGSKPNQEYAITVKRRYDDSTYLLYRMAADKNSAMASINKIIDANEVIIDIQLVAQMQPSKL